MWSGTFEVVAAILNAVATGEVFDMDKVSKQ